MKILLYFDITTVFSRVLRELLYSVVMVLVQRAQCAILVLFTHVSPAEKNGEEKFSAFPFVDEGH